MSDAAPMLCGRMMPSQLLSKKNRLVVGLMSGTSCDGVDVAFVEIERREGKVEFNLRHFAEFPFEQELRSRLLALAEIETCRIDQLCITNFQLARFYTRVIKAAAAEASIPLDSIDLIGSHGQTIHHLPEQGATLQIGEPSVIAEAFGVPVVADFRPMDMAAGGQGAPLVPYVDYLLLRHEKNGRAIQNIGGIGNVTWLPPVCSPDQVIAFDTGPGNMLLDALMAKLTGGEKLFDASGDFAARGKVCREVLNQLLSHPYFESPPPKSTGRELFGSHFVESLLQKSEALALNNQDIMATATAFTVESIRLSYDRFLLPNGPVDELIASGGGVKNKTIMRGLQSAFEGRCRVTTSDEFGLPSAAREAISFAILANETIDGRPNNLPSATGAGRAVVLGKVVWCGPR
ncbi:MAG: anhydro-N-acetylmuramic acid kinase [Planctomycetota bacterium]|nr:anhydro-N-acetylmuramic acid kinase [Planctomycetota bacterium]